MRDELRGLNENGVAALGAAAVAKEHPAKDQWDGWDPTHRQRQWDTMRDKWAKHKNPERQQEATLNPAADTPEPAPTGMLDRLKALVKDKRKAAALGALGITAATLAANYIPPEAYENIDPVLPLTIGLGGLGMWQINLGTKYYSEGDSKRGSTGMGLGNMALTSLAAANGAINSGSTDAIEYPLTQIPLMAAAATQYGKNHLDAGGGNKIKHLLSTLSGRYTLGPAAAVSIASGYLLYETGQFDASDRIDLVKRVSFGLLPVSFTMDSSLKRFSLTFAGRLGIVSALAAEVVFRKNPSPLPVAWMAINGYGLKQDFKNVFKHAKKAMQSRRDRQDAAKLDSSPSTPDHADEVLEEPK